VWCAEVKPVSIVAHSMRTYALVRALCLQSGDSFPGYAPLGQPNSA